MARKYPKYIKPTGNTLGYQRAIPTRLFHVSTKKLWTYSLGLPVSASDTQIATSWAKAQMLTSWDKITGTKGLARVKVDLA